MSRRRGRDVVVDVEFFVRKSYRTTNHQKVSDRARSLYLCINDRELHIRLPSYVFSVGTLSQNDNDSDEDSEENLIFDEYSDDEMVHNTSTTNGHAATGRVRMW